MEHRQMDKLFLVFTLVVTLCFSQPIEPTAKSLSIWGRFLPSNMAQTTKEESVSKIVSISSWSDIFEEIEEWWSQRTTQCGVSNSSPKEVVGVVGGEDADKNEWPWMAMLMEGGEQFCDGSIIDEYHILTAAHCVYGMSENDVPSLKVRLGAHNLQNSANETGVQDIGVKLVAKHKDFEWETGHSDIAILVLKSPIKYTNTVRPVCLPAGKASYAGEKGTVAGWGLLSNWGSQPTVLQELTKEIWDNQLCSKTYYGTAPFNVTDTMLCAGKEGKSSCNGDSGGPLMIPNGDHWEQIGVVSWGYACGMDIYPSVYTRVTHFMDWIEKTRRLYPN